jgi:hypothetical protein
MSADPSGQTCPAALPLCPCGVRGCAQAEAHATAFTGRVPLFRLRSKGSRRHNRYR